MVSRMKEPNSHYYFMIGWISSPGLHTRQAIFRDMRQTEKFKFLKNNYSKFVQPDMRLALNHKNMKQQEKNLRTY